MSKLVISLAILLGLMISAPAVKAATLWSEDFSNVSDWGIVYDPGSGSTLTASGGLGALYVDKGSNQAAFAPNQADANFIPFDRTNSSEYSLNFIVDHLTWSTSYDIAMDEFNSSKAWVGTIWQVYPVQYTSTDTGSHSRNLGDLTWDSNVAYLIPKVNVHTGDPAQTVYFDNMSMDQNPIPEPASLLLLGSGLVGLLGVSRKKK